MVIALFGPTGVGKTDTAVALAERLRARREDPVAISADALQVYAGLEALTGAATLQQRERLEHRLVGFVPVTEEFSVGAYMRLAHREIDRALDAGRRPIVVGGTGLYVRAALADLRLAPPPPAELRDRLERRMAAQGPVELHAALAEGAPDVAATIHPRDRSRVLRALERLELAGEGRASAEPGASTGRAGASQLWSGDTRRPTALFGLTMDRDELYARVDARVDAIVDAGAVEEVRRAAAAGASRTARAALGFEELLAGDLDAMRRRSRNYAKRQLTWMRKLADVTTIDVTGRDADQVAAEVDERLSCGTRATGE